MSLLLFQGFQPFLNNSHYDKPATHCPCLQIGVGAEHSLLLLQPEEELFLEIFPKKTKTSPRTWMLKNLPRNFQFKKKFGYHIKPLSTHLPLCRSQCSPGSVHLKSMQPRHLEVIGSQVGWGALHSWLLEQPRNMYFLFNEQGKIAIHSSIF